MAEDPNDMVMLVTTEIKGHSVNFINPLPGFAESSRIEQRLQMIRALIRTTEYLPFNCDFDKNGICSKQRSSGVKPKDGGDPTKSCCCGACSYHFGYHNEENVVTCLLENKDEYEQKFDKKLGFWRPGKGCNLPIELRSLTCLFHNCNLNNGRIKEAKLISSLRDITNQLAIDTETIIRRQRRWMEGMEW